ncbi:MAG: peptide ABC transporter substrate-binding protein, partial [Planctomycetes bacterium]|nr:peptide ABC transporter substrate-binding protein [Planctomycetota bacterium]
TTPQRGELNERVLEIRRHDAPWEFGFYPESYVLAHDWLNNYKPNNMANNVLKYLAVDAAAREAYRNVENSPRWGWVLLLVGGTLVVVLPGLAAALKRGMV